MRFLGLAENSAAIRSMLEDAKVSKCAVAYVGRDALDWIPRHSESFQLICDLNSGGCNPAAVDKLRKRVATRQLRDLHAKVYWTPEKAIVSSANLSLNGLSVGGEEPTGLLEAGIETTDPALLSEIRDWFDGLWAEALPINSDDIAYAKEQWMRRLVLARRARGIRNLKRPPITLLEAVKQNPAEFDRVYIAATWSDRSLAGEALHKQKVVEAEARGEIISSYDDWPDFPTNAYVVGFFCDDKKGSSVGYDGVWLSPPGGLYADYGDGKNAGRLTLVFRSEVPDGIPSGKNAYRLTKKEIALMKKSLGRVIKSHLKAGETGIVVKLAEVMNLVS